MSKKRQDKIQTGEDRFNKWSEEFTTNPELAAIYEAEAQKKESEITGRLLDKLPINLIKKWVKARITAKRYQAKHGDPIENLENLLNRVVQNEELWESLINQTDYTEEDE